MNTRACIIAVILFGLLCLAEYQTDRLGSSVLFGIIAAVALFWIISGKSSEV